MCKIITGAHGFGSVLKILVLEQCSYICVTADCSGLEIQNTQVSYEFDGDFDSKALTLLFFMDCRIYGKIVTFHVGKQLIKKKSDVLFYVFGRLFILEMVSWL